jgi:hypothetical protein
MRITNTKNATTKLSELFDNYKTTGSVEKTKELYVKKATETAQKLLDMYLQGSGDTLVHLRNTGLARPLTVNIDLFDAIDGCDVDPKEIASLVDQAIDNVNDMIKIDPNRILTSPVTTKHVDFTTEEVSTELMGLGAYIRTEVLYTTELPKHLNRH